MSFDFITVLQHGDPSMTQQIVYRFEEIPRDELELGPDELLVPVSHFFKDIYSVFGIPFFIRVKQAEPFGRLKERIQKRLGVPDKEWEKVNTHCRVRSRQRAAVKRSTNHFHTHLSIFSINLH